MPNYIYKFSHNDFVATIYLQNREILFMKYRPSPLHCDIFEFGEYRTLSDSESASLFKAFCIQSLLDILSDDSGLEFQSFEELGIGDVNWDKVFEII